MKIAVVLASIPITTVCKKILEAKGHEITDVQAAELVIADEPRMLLTALKDGKRVVQFVAWPNTGKVASGLLESEFADRVQIFAPSEDQHGTIDWLDNFGNFLCSLNPADAEKE